MHARNYWEGQTIITNEDNNNELLAWSIRQFRRTILSDFIYGMVQAFEDFDYSLPQMATLLFLDEQGELTIKQVAEAQISVMDYLSAEERATVTRGMVLLAEAAQRRREQHESPTTRTKASKTS